MQAQYINSFEKHASEKLQHALYTTLSKDINNKSNIVILCIGTDRATGDCLGPLVGEYLKNHHLPIPIYGTLSHPVHALNLESTRNEIFQSISNPYIIAVDASLGVREHIGYATVSQTPLFPGKGVNKKIPAIGNISITGIVNISGFPNSILLQNTRLHTVVTLASCIGNAISQCFTGPEERVSNFINE